jgi:hypothetical protein
MKVPPHEVPAAALRDDAKSAFLLSSCFALAAAATVPAMLPSLPEDARQLPLQLPAFCAALAVQMTLLYGVLGLAGLRLARSQGREPAPLLTAWWQNRSARWQPLGWAFVVGLGGGVLLVGAVAAIQRLAPETLPSILHPPSPVAALLASTAGSIGEEILCRLFLLSLLLRVLPDRPVGIAAALVTSAALFGALHAPAFVMLFGGIEGVPPLAWAWVMGLNGPLGLAFGLLFLRYGIGAAIAAHFATDLIWHVATQLAA